MKGYQEKPQSAKGQFSKEEVSSFYPANMLDCRQFNSMKPIQRKPSSECHNSSKENSESSEPLEELTLSYLRTLKEEASTSDGHSDKKEQEPHKIESFSFDPVLESLIEEGNLVASDHVFDKDRTFVQALQQGGPRNVNDIGAFIQKESQRLEENYTEDLRNENQTNEINFVSTSKGVDNQSKTIRGNLIMRLLMTMESCEYFGEIKEDTKRTIIDGYMSGYLTKAEKVEIGRLTLELIEMQEDAERIVRPWAKLTDEKRLGKADEAEAICTKLLEKKKQIDARVAEIEQRHKEANEAGKLAQKEVYFRMLGKAIQDIGGYICQLNIVDYFSVFGIRDWVESKWAFLQDVNLFLRANPQLLDLSKKEDQQFLFMHSFINTFQGAWLSAAIDLGDASFPGEPTADKLELHQINQPVKPILVEFSYLIQGLRKLGVPVPQLTPDQQSRYDESRRERAAIERVERFGFFVPRLMNIQQQDGDGRRQARAQAYREKNRTLEGEKILESNADIIQKNMDNRDLATMAEEVQKRIITYWAGDDMTTDNTVHRIIGELYDIACIVDDNNNVNDVEKMSTRVSKLIFSFQRSINNDMDRVHRKRPEDVEFFKEFLMRFFLQLPI